jgi:hypothetical protein
VKSNYRLSETYTLSEVDALKQWIENREQKAQTKIPAALTRSGK